MLIAFNNDIEFRSRWYHIQTEDNGIKDGHITTTVFFSGQILESKSISYIEKIEGIQDVEEQNAIIKDLMVAQHRVFYQKLYEGNYEELVNDIVNRVVRPSAAQSKLPPAPSSTKSAPPPSLSPIPIKKSKPESLLPPSIQNPSHSSARASSAQIPAVTPISKAVQTQRMKKEALCYNGMTWPAEDFSLDVLVADFLEAANA